MSELGTYNVNETVKLYALFLDNAQRGSILKGQTLLLLEDDEGLDLSNGTTIVVVGAGVLGGELRTTVASHSGRKVTLTDPAEVDAHLVSVGNPSTPGAVTCKVKKPDGNELTPATTLVTAGRYKAQVTPDSDGDWFYRFSGTGTVSADAWRKFVVRPERVP